MGKKTTEGLWMGYMIDDVVVNIFPRSWVGHYGSIKFSPHFMHHNILFLRNSRKPKCLKKIGISDYLGGTQVNNFQLLSWITITQAFPRE